MRFTKTCVEQIQRGIDGLARPVVAEGGETMAREELPLPQAEILGLSRAIPLQAKRTGQSYLCTSVEPEQL